MTFAPRRMSTQGGSFGQPLRPRSLPVVSGPGFLPKPAQPLANTMNPQTPGRPRTLPLSAGVQSHPPWGPGNPPPFDPNPVPPEWPYEPPPGWVEPPPVQPPPVIQPEVWWTPEPGPGGIPQWLGPTGTTLKELLKNPEILKIWMEYQGALTAAMGGGGGGGGKVPPEGGSVEEPSYPVPGAYPTREQTPWLIAEGGPSPATPPPGTYPWGGADYRNNFGMAVPRQDNRPAWTNNPYASLTDLLRQYRP